MSVKSTSLAKLRRTQLLEAGLIACQQRMFNDITRDDVAAFAGLAGSNINAHFGTLDKFRHAVIELAVERRIVKIVADALGMRHPAIAGIPDDLKADALKELAK